MKWLVQAILQKEIGDVIPGLMIHGKPAPYGVLNERAIRAAAGLMFLVGIITFFIVLSTRDTNYIYPALTLIWLQFFISVFFGTKYAPFSIVWRWIVSHQQPDYVGAVQKRFAWTLGFMMATMMFFFVGFLDLTGVVPFVMCSVCLALMWLESSCGICVGCKIYGFLLTKWIIQEPEHRPACPGGACSFTPKV